MPSEEFMQRVLGTGRNDIIEDIEDPFEEQPEAEGDPGDEQPEESVPAESGEEPDEQPEGEPEDEQEDQPEDQPAEEEGQPPEAVEHEEEFYLGTYKDREAAEKGWLEKEQMISRQGGELAQLRQQMAEMQGYLQGVQQRPAQEGEFEAWAEGHIQQGNGWGGANEALDAALQSGDPSYVDGYIDVWKEHDPFEAARFRTMVDQQIAEAQRISAYENQPPPPQQMLNQVWLEMAADDATLADPEHAKEIGAILKGNTALRGAATSGNPEAIRDAIRVARDGYTMQARTQGGTPRKVRSSDAERTQQEKLDASVTTGDSSPDRGNGSTPEVPPELQDMMQRISAGEGGFPKLRE